LTPLSSNRNSYPCRASKSIPDAYGTFLPIHLIERPMSMVFSSVVTKLVIAHPCMVLRRQCQVHQNARSLHLTPFTLVPVVCNMVANEGIMTFWKGSVGSCVLWGLSNVTEIVLADLFGLPRHIVPNGSTAKYWKHILSAVLALTPFFVSTFTETVRSESGLGGEGPSVMEVLVRGIDRLRWFPIFGSKDSSRRFSVLHLAAPTVFYRTSHYIIQRKLYYQFFKMARKYVNKKPEAERKKFHQYIPQMFAQTSSTIVTDLILFPVETIMHRMYIQGTRTLIDNLDTGLSAISITAKYSGFVDCFRSVFQHEGFCALYSGVGALALEYLLHSLLHQAVRACFDRGSEVRSRQFWGNYVGHQVFLFPFYCQDFVNIDIDTNLFEKLDSIFTRQTRMLQPRFHHSTTVLTLTSKEELGRAIQSRQNYLQPPSRISCEHWNGITWE
uniref:Solute carrier family 25 member 46 n=1 Tax=Angiostrongylus cantonensis TaxID=6313 RepID=A0A0K0CZH6_ANGCA